MENNCYTGTTVPPILEIEPCEGIYKNDVCVIHESAIPYLELPANSSVKEVINNLVLALLYKDEQILNLQEELDDVALDYKVYTATVSQANNYSSLTPGSDFIIGEQYFITSLSLGDDFTNIGFTALETLFTATGTTPTAWTYSGVKIFNEDVLPLISTLENTLNITLVSEFNDISDSATSFKLVSNLPIFLESKTTLSPYGWGDTNNVAQAKGLFRVDNSTLILGQMNPLGSYKPFRIEIKVYN